MAYIDNVTNILQIQPDGLPTFVRLSQNENGRNLYFQLAGNEIDIPANSTVTISGTKPDGNVYSGTGSISNNTVMIPEMIQMTAVAGTWDAKIHITSGGNTIATGRVRFIVDADTVDPDAVPSSSELEGLVAEAQQYAETARTEAYGSPLTAQTAAGMTDHTRVYVYTGSESGYTAGHWYYWDGTQWADGGIYNSVAVNTDPTLTLTGVAADAKATGDAIEAARVAIDDTLSNTGEAADAKVVGDELADLKSDLNISNENGYKTETGITWTQGRISPSTGGPVSSDTTAIYSSTILADEYDVSFFATSTGSYTVSVYEYTGAAWNDYASVKFNGDNMPVLFKVTAGRYYRLVVKKSDGTALAPGELTNFTLLHHISQEYIVNTLNSSVVNVNELQTNMDTIKENTENINTVGQGRYYMTSAGVIKPSSENYIGMPSTIPCEEGYDYTVTVFYDGATTTNGYYVVWYDNSDAMVGTRQNINTKNKYTTFTAPETAVKMVASVFNSSGVSADAKISITKGSTPASIYEYPVTAKDTVARSIAYIASNLVTACNASLNKKILTWIDDDTGLSAIPTIKSICDTHGIKCTFACITSRLNDTLLVNLLKSYQEYGFHVTCHSHTHGTWYGDNPYNAEQIENDLIISLKALRDNGFLDSDMLVYPGSSPSRTDIDVVGIVRKWCKCGVKASGTNFTGYGDGKYLINRVFFDVSLHDASYYTGILDNYAVNDAPWVVFGSHSSNDTQFDETLVNTVIQYAKANGWTFMTLNEAIKYRQKYFDIKEMFGL